MRGPYTRSQGLLLVIAGAGRSVNHCGRTLLRFAPDLDAEEHRLAERRTALPAADPHQRHDRPLALRAGGDDRTSAVGARAGYGRSVALHEAATPSAAQAEAATVPQLRVAPRSHTPILPHSSLGDCGPARRIDTAGSTATLGARMAVAREATPVESAEDV